MDSFSKEKTLCGSFDSITGRRELWCCKSSQKRLIMMKEGTLQMTGGAACKTSDVHSRNMSVKDDEEKEGLMC